MGHFLQSSAWETFQQKLGRATFSDRGEGWSYRAVLEKGVGNSRLYVPYGPEVDGEASLKAAVDVLKSQAENQGATFLRIEPTFPAPPSLLKSLGFQPVTYQQLNPRRTQVIDLTPSKTDILAQMSQNSRNLTRNYQNKGITIQTSTAPKDITILTDLLEKVAVRAGMTPHSPAYFAQQAEALFPLGAACLYYALLDDTPIAAALVYDSDTTRYYAHAAADDTYRKLSPGTALVGQMILDAKDKGLLTVDLYGIAPQGATNHPWSGFTKFKQSFGGQPLEFPGAWDLPLRPVRYWAYRTYQAIRHRLR